ncbi:hypothetical protein DFP72DRAFT_1071682 [Ephemerocybe angulata]|uniref:CRIB domain-containing protein n=1 Tax=Ephemerocybe angulata TaxID=980116 RepID=A0A8H6HSS9_9AGAR|nr:hypothetical protein DFP72DRAFT_1071682 [Tulosesus angulatus]
MSASTTNSVSSLPQASRGAGGPTSNESAETNLAAPSIHAIATARIYHTELHSQRDEWTYSQLKGTLKFGQNWSTSKHGTAPSPYNRRQSVDDAAQYWFTLSDDMTGKTIWMFQIPVPGFFYEVDKPFFHVFNGRTRKYGFRFDDDEEAAIFSRKVVNETCRDGASPKRGRSLKTKRSIRSKSLSGSISRKLISSPAPNSFRHISHIGVNRGGVFEISKDLDSAFKESLVKLQGTDAARMIVVLDSNTNFLESFWKDVESARAQSLHRGLIGSEKPPSAVAVC